MEKVAEIRVVDVPSTIGIGLFIGCLIGIAAGVCSYHLGRLDGQWSVIQVIIEREGGVAGSSVAGKVADLP